MYSFNIYHKSMIPVLLNSQLSRFLKGLFSDAISGEVDTLFKSFVQEYPHGGIFRK